MHPSGLPASKRGGFYLSHYAIMRFERIVSQKEKEAARQAGGHVRGRAYALRDARASAQ